jgi:hypothetical protein
MERAEPKKVTVAVDCYRQNACPRSPIAGDGSCFELVPKEIIIPFDLCIKGRVESLNHEEPLRPCQLGHPRFRTSEIIEETD